MKSKFLKLLVLSLFIFTISGCGQKTPQAKILKRLQALSDIMEENRDDCLKAAEKVSQWSAQNAEELKVLKAEAKTLSAKKKAKLKKRYKGRTKIAMAKIMRTTLKCSKEPKFTEAMKNINLK